MNYIGIVLICATMIYSARAEVEKRYVSMETITQMCESVHEQMVQDNYQPQCIVVLSRGGLVSGGLLVSEQMLNNRNVKVVAITSYSDERNRSQHKLLFPQALRELEDLGLFNSVLIVDEIADTGATLAYVIDMIRQMAPHIAIKTAVLFYKDRSSIIKPDYYAATTDEWIVFPWEK